MTKKERIEIDELPVKYMPMGAWSTFGWSIVYAFPIVGFVFLCINALRSSNIARRNHARMYFCILFIAMILIGAIVGVLIATGVLNGLIESAKALIQAYIS